MKYNQKEPVLAIILLVMLINNIAVAAISDLPNEYKLEAKLGLLAVEEEGRGSVINTTLVLEWGSGEVLAEPRFLVNESVIISTKVGFYIASLLAHKNPHSYDVELYIDTEETVSGASASGFISATILLLLEGYEVSNKTTMTGMVSSLGFLLPVAGVKEKISAAERVGYKQVILPSVLRNTSTEYKNSSIKIRYACNIAEASEIIAWNNTIGVNDLDTLTTYLDSYYREVNAEELEPFRAITQRFLSILDSIRYNPTDEELRGRVDKLARQARSILEEDPYSAASLAFVALYTASIDISKKSFKELEDLIGLSLNQSLRIGREAVERAHNYVAVNERCNLPAYFALAAAEVRLYLAENAANAEDNETKALALLRAISAETWANTAIHASKTTSATISCERLQTITEFIVNYSELIYNYLKSLQYGREIEIPMPDERKIVEWLKDSKRYLLDGNYERALGISLYIIDTIEGALIVGSGVSEECIWKHMLEVIEVVDEKAGLSLPFILISRYTIHEGRFLEDVLEDSYQTEFLGVSAITWLLPILVEESVLAEVNKSAEWSKREINLDLALEVLLLATLIIVGLRFTRYMVLREEV